MPDMLSSGHVVTDEDVDTARLIIELDRALGRATDPLTRQVAETPGHRVRTVLAAPVTTTDAALDRQPDVSSPDGAGSDGAGSDGRGSDGPGPVRTGVNGHRLPRVDALARSVAEEVGSELPASLEPAEQARVVSRIEDVLRRRMGQLVAEVDPGR